MADLEKRLEELAPCPLANRIEDYPHQQANTEPEEAKDEDNGCDAGGGVQGAAGALCSRMA
jgi:hypothetical protein